MDKIIIQGGYLVCQVIPDTEFNHVIPDRVFMDEKEAKGFVNRNPTYEIYNVPVILESVIVRVEDLTPANASSVIVRKANVV